MLISPIKTSSNAFISQIKLIKTPDTQMQDAINPRKMRGSIKN